MAMNLQRQCAEVEVMVPQMRMRGRGGQVVTGGGEGGGGGATDEKGANGSGRTGNNVGSTQRNSNREQAGRDHGLR